MKQIMRTLLATDDVAQQYGCRLKPELRAAIEAGLQFPVYAASPLPRNDELSGNLPENVVRMGASAPEKQRSSA